MTGPVWDVLGIGENSVDETLRLASPLGRSSAGGVSASKIQIVSRTRLPGGQVATTLSTCAAFGLRTAYAGVFGDDEPGIFIRQEMERRGIDTSCAIVRAVPNRSATILVNDADGERVVLSHRDAGLALGPGDIRPDVIARARVVHLDNVDEEAAIRAALLARAAGAPVTTDIDVVTHRTDALVAEVTVGIFAEHAPLAMTGELDVERALRALRQRYGARVPLLCVTRGRRGAALLQGDEFHESPGVPVRAVDTTGAGDVFRGAFITAWIRGDAPAEILRFANTAAALSCTRHGAMPSVPSPEEQRTALSAMDPSA
jgi:sugar/nucleoside kinase (ribokinase family)